MIATPSLTRIGACLGAAALACLATTAAAEPATITLRGLVATDARAFVGDVPVSATERSTVAVRAAGLQLDATAYERLRVQLLVNLADRLAPVTMATIELDVGPALHARVGKFPFPLTQERLTPPLSLPFVGSSLVGLLVPPFDTGVHLRGDLFAARASYDLALVNGAVPGGTGDGDLDGGKDVVARIFVRPFAAGLGLGVGASWGVHRGRTAAPGTPVLRTYGGQPFFSYRNDALADGDTARVAPHLVWSHGPLALQSDAIWVREHVAATAVDVYAWDVIPTVVLTGEAAAPFAFVVPRRPLGGGDGGLGTFILVAGFGQLVVDEAAFAGPASPADPASAAAGMNVAGTGLKWYPVSGLALFIDYGHMWFRAAPGGMRRAPEDTVIARLQVIL